MKKGLLVILAAVMALTMVMASVTTASAAAPVKNPSLTFTITRVDVATQTIYYTTSWSNLPKTMAVSGFVATFYYYDSDVPQNLIAVTSKSFNKTKTSYTSPELSAVRSTWDHTFQSGDWIQGTLDLYDTTDNLILPDHYYFNYLVP
jgi:uncharacterized protein (UPF0333 family)